MDEIIKIHPENGDFPIDARELHEKLNVGRDFSNWIKGRIDQYNLIENIDYIVVKPAKPSLTKNGDGVNTRFKPIDYKLTFDTGKELAMVENNEEGRKVRRYFIQAEKEWREGKTVQLIGKVVRRELTDALRDSGLNEKMHGYGYNTFTDLIYKLVLGMDARKYRETFGLPKDANVREHLNAFQLQEVSRLENASQGLINIGMDYQEVKSILMEKFLPKPTKLIELKSGK